jgi:uncharacterized membrane protein
VEQRGRSPSAAHHIAAAVVASLTSDDGRHNPEVARHSLHEEEVESRWEAAPAVALVIALQLALSIVSRAQHWTLWHLPWWVWLIPVGPEILLVNVLAWERPRRRLEQRGRRRMVALVLLGLISLANALLLVAVLASLIHGVEKSGSQLLVKALIVWASSAITYGLWYWELDRGGPIRRLQGDVAAPDFRFPQMDEKASDWQPELLDYVYVSFTNSIAFSPTDTMPLSHRAKLLMLSEATISSLTVLLVAARAVNIFR